MKLHEIINILNQNNVEFTVYDGEVIEIIITNHVFDLKIDRCYNLYFKKDELIDIFVFTWINDEIQVNDATLTYDEFVEELNLKNYTSKQAIIELLIDENIYFENEGDIITIRFNDDMLYTEYGIRFDEYEELQRISVFVYDYTTESVLRDEEIEFVDQLIDELRRYPK